MMGERYWYGARPPGWLVCGGGGQHGKWFFYIFIPTLYTVYPQVNTVMWYILGGPQVNTLMWYILGDPDDLPELNTDMECILGDPRAPSTAVHWQVMFLFPGFISLPAEIFIVAENFRAGGEEVGQRSLASQTLHQPTVAAPLGSRTHLCKIYITSKYLPVFTWCIPYTWSWNTTTTN